MPDPPVVQQMEVENNVAATNTAEANDPVLVEDYVEPEANVVPKVNVNPKASVTLVPLTALFLPQDLSLWKRLSIVMGSWS